jgi:CBS domain-containing protein
MATVQDILSTKSSKVLTTRRDATVLEAINKMNEHGVGALVVYDGTNVVGMFTERDVLKKVAVSDRSPREIVVEDVMTNDAICTGPREDLDEVRTVMKNRRIRHLPVCDEHDGHLLGLVSMGDLNAFEASHREATIHFLSEYIYGRV